MIDSCKTYEVDEELIRLTGESNCFYLTREHQAYFPKFIVLVLVIFFLKVLYFFRLLGMLLLVSAMLGLVTSLSDLHVQQSPHNARENVSAGASLGLKVRKVILLVEGVAISTPICSSPLIKNAV